MTASGIEMSRRRLEHWWIDVNPRLQQLFNARG